MKSWPVVLVSSAVLYAGSVDAAPPRDPRFFGTYCEAEPIPLCKRVRTSFLGFPTGTREVCATLENVRARLNHLDTPKGGLVTGHGTFTLDGEPTGFVMSGAVLRRGYLRGPVVVSGLGRDLGAARLSLDGLALTVFAQGESVPLRKDACGNGPPRVSITTPADGTSLVFGRNQNFHAEAEDDEDDSFAGRMVFSSDRDGPLVGSTLTFPTGMTVFTSTLSPGDHVITFSATDSGGLTAETSIRVSVTNEGPEPPFIVQPRTDDTVVATGDVVLEGKGFDFEDGLLRGSALRWESSVGGGPFDFLGVGQTLTTAFDTPGATTIRLIARDSLGAEAATDRTIHVLPFDGNTPPRVTIEKPNHLESKGEVAGALVAGAIDFVGTVADTEDAASDLTLAWIAEAIDPAGGTQTFGSSSTAASLTLLPAQNTRYRITFRATDSGGLVGRKVIDILVLSRPIL